MFFIRRRTNPNGADSTTTIPTKLDGMCPRGDCATKDDGTGFGITDRERTHGCSALQNSIEPDGEFDVL